MAAWNSVISSMSGPIPELPDGLSADAPQTRRIQAVFRKIRAACPMPTCVDDNASTTLAAALVGWPHAY